MYLVIRKILKSEINWIGTVVNAELTVLFQLFLFLTMNPC